MRKIQCVGLKIEEGVLVPVPHYMKSRTEALDDMGDMGVVALGMIGKIGPALRRAAESSGVFETLLLRLMNVNAQSEEDRHAIANQDMSHVMSTDTGAVMLEHSDMMTDHLLDVIRVGNTNSLYWRCQHTGDEVIDDVHLAGDVKTLLLGLSDGIYATSMLSIVKVRDWLGYDDDILPTAVGRGFTMNSVVTDLLKRDEVRLQAISDLIRQPIERVGMSGIRIGDVTILTSLEK